MSPMQLTKQLLKSEGWTFDVTERWNSFAHIRQDLFGFGDLIGVKQEELGATIFQVTTGDHHAERVKKIRANENAGQWLKSGNRIKVISWREKRAPGRRTKFTSRVEEIRALDLGRPGGGDADHAGCSTVSAVAE